MESDSPSVERLTHRLVQSPQSELNAEREECQQQKAAAAKLEGDLSDLSGAYNTLEVQIGPLLFQFTEVSDLSSSVAEAAAALAYPSITSVLPVMSCRHTATLWKGKSRSCS